MHGGIARLSSVIIFPVDRLSSSERLKSGILDNMIVDIVEDDVVRTSDLHDDQVYGLE